MIYDEIYIEMFRKSARCEFVPQNVSSLEISGIFIIHLECGEWDECHSTTWKWNGISQSKYSVLVERKNRPHIKRKNCFSRKFTEISQRKKHRLNF